MSAFDKLIDAVKSALGKNTRAGSRNVRPASQDPYGDPADEARFGGRSVRPAAEDPYGDPAEPATFRNRSVKSASQDPYGDPADEPRRR